MLSKQLNEVISLEAKRLAEKIGFSYIPDVMAPATYKELCFVFANCSRSSCPLPVYSGGSESTIYGATEVNYAFRFWHDVEHVLGGNSFSLKGETQTAFRQLDTLENVYGFGRETIEWKLLHADVIGQVEYYYKNKKFVENQVEFVLNFLK